ncbi:hypothetical protein HID58_029441, partial [Brassica napus]
MESMISLTTSFWSEKLRKFAAFLTLSSIIHHRRCKTSLICKDVIYLKIEAYQKFTIESASVVVESYVRKGIHENSIACKTLLIKNVHFRIKLNIKALAVQSGRGRVIKSEQNIRVLHVNQLCILQCHLVRDQRNLR